ncbi:hypothetical protein DFS34DRAFT_582818, partial [Phlyctochytrium arcticum]
MNDSHRASWQPATTPVVSLDDSETDSVRHTFSMVEPDKSNFQNSQQSTAAAATTEDESDDPFNKFWEAVENLVEKISLTGPVAFATAPLDSESGGNPSGSINSVNSNGTGDPLSPSGRDMGDTLRTTTMLNSYFIVPGGGIGDSGMNGTYRTSYGSSNISGSRQPGYQQHLGNTGRILQYCKRVRSNKTMEELVMENEHLRHAVDILTRKVAILERAAEENNLLKSSIIQFRQDVQKQAKRFMHQTPASASGGIGASFGGGRLRTGGSGHESHDIAQNLSHRVQELEEELRRQKEESDRQSLAMAKYKERWDKLKESAKKKKEA